MTLQDIVNIPKGMNFTEYEDLLKEKRKLEKIIWEASNAIDFEMDSLEVLQGEKGSDRYNKHLKAKRKEKIKKEKAQNKLNNIAKMIH